MKNSAIYYSTNQNRIKLLYIYGIVFLAFSAVLGIMLGSTLLSPGEIWQAFSNGAHFSAGTRILAYVRFPRTLGSVVCGAALAVSGAVIQNIFANRLASPGIIGVNSGAGLAVTVCAAFGLYGGFALSVFAFAGAFAAVMTVSFASYKWGASRSTVILIGVALNSLLGALSDAVITFIPEVGVMTNDFKVGEFSAVTFQNLIPASVLMLAAFAMLVILTNELDVLTLGEENARALGMNTALMRTLFLLLAAILAGCAVSIAGLLSFVGLIVPNTVKRFSGGSSLHTIGLCALFGGGFVCLCDTLARTVFTPYEIPVGIIMAFLGAPFFVFILIKGKGGHAGD